MTDKAHALDGFETLIVEVDDGVATVSINRPAAANSISQKLDAEFGRLWPALRDEPGVDVVILTAVGDRFFCTGADVKEWAATKAIPMSNTADGHGFRLLSRDHGFFKPIICAVNGVCAGGGLHFVSDSDIVIASRSATFSDPHVSIGQVTAHEPISLTRRIPYGEVMRMILMGVQEAMTAERALQIGLVSELVDPDDLMPRARELAHMVRKNSGAAMQKSKQAVIDSLDRGLSDGLYWGFGVIQSHWTHPDYDEGPLAFFERRTPVWAPIGASSNPADGEA